MAGVEIMMPTGGLDGLDEEGDTSPDVMSVNKDSSNIKPTNLDARMKESETEEAEVPPIVRKELSRTGQVGTLDGALGGVENEFIVIGYFDEYNLRPPVDDTRG